MSKPVVKKNEDLVGELILKLLVDPDDECFLNALNSFNQNKQLTKFHKLLFGQQIEVQQNLDKKRDLIEKLKNEWTAGSDEEDRKPTNQAESEITYQFLYSTLSNYGKLIANLPFSQKLDLWSTFLEQDLTTNQLCSQLFAAFILHFDATSSKITPLFQSSLDTLIERTNQLFEQSVDLSLLDSSHNLIRWLELIYNWGQFLFLNKLYSKEKSTKLIDESASESSSFSGYRLHSYKESGFWKKFIKQSLKKEEKSLEISELTVKLVIQNLTFVNSSAIGPFRTEKAGLHKFNREATGLILQQITQRPSLVFYLNAEQFYELFSDDDLAALLSLLFEQYAKHKEAKFLKFLSQNYFQSSKRVQILSIKVFIKLLAELCSQNEVKNPGYLELLAAIQQKDWPSEVHASVPVKLKEKTENKFHTDLTEIAARLDGITPASDRPQDERIRNLLHLLQCCVPPKDLLPSNQCLLLIVTVGFLSAYRPDAQLSVLAFNILTETFCSNQSTRLFDFYAPSAFIKKLFVALAPFNVNSLLPLIISILSKILFRCLYFKDVQVMKELLTFFSLIDSKLNDASRSKAKSNAKASGIEELQFVLRAMFLIELNKELEKKRKWRKDSRELLDDNEMRQLFSANIEQCLKQLDKRLEDDAYSRAFRVCCIQGALQFFNLKDLDLINKLSFERYFDLSIRLTFEGIHELTIKQATDPNAKNTLSNYLKFLFQNETIYNSKMTKLELIKRVWTRLVFKPLDLKPLELFNCQADEFSGRLKSEQGDEQAVDNKKRKSTDDHPGSKRMKENGALSSALSDELSSATSQKKNLNIDILLELTKITLQHCSPDQLDEFLNCLLADLKEFNSNFLADSVDFSKLKTRSNLLLLIKIIFHNIKEVVASEKAKLELLKGEFIEQLIVQVVGFAQNIYCVKIELQAALEKELAREKQDEITSRLEDELKAKLGQIHQAQLLSLETVDAILNNFRPLGNLTSQQVNYLMHVASFVDLASYRNDDPTHFASIFNVVYSILNRVLIDYKHTVTSAFSAYTSLICGLLENLCKISYQIRFLNLRPDTQREIERCSVNLQHLLLLLARTKEYTFCTSNIIARFIREMQNDLIYSTIKHRILIGIYKLLNSSQSDDKFQSIYSRLNQEGRQMFKQIYENYEKFYRYKGYV